MSHSISTQELDESNLFWPPNWQQDMWPQALATTTATTTTAINNTGSTPRSCLRDLAGTDLALANDANLGPFDSRHWDDGRTPLDLLDSAPAMARTATIPPGSHDGYRSAPTSTHPFYSSSVNSNGKRDIHHVDMDHSLSYTYGSTPGSSQTTTGTATISHPRVDEFQVFEPADYCLKLSSDSEEPEGMPFASSKKPRVDCLNASPRSSQCAYPSNMCMPSAHPHVSPSTSMSTHLSPPSSLASGEEMSRQSSVTSASVTGALDMMRVQSSCSTASDIFSVDDLDASFLSCATEKPAVSSQPTIGFDSGGAATLLLSNVGYGLVGTEFPFVDHRLSDEPVIVAGQQYAHGHSLPTASGEDMVRSASQSSTSSSSSSSSSSSNSSNYNSSSDAKACERRRKHIENGRQNIAPKSNPDGPLSASSKSSTDSIQTIIKREDTSSSSSKRSKEAIAKAPYVRPQHPKLYCTMCDEFPGGFRGEHELRRHWDRAHAEYRKVWICTEPTTRTEWWPAKPLGICKQCKQQKQYNVYYNAAAHLRRAHFCPRKRGRKARGEERESRAGKAGGDWPPIDWLKAHGWLKEIEVTSEQAFGQALRGGGGGGVGMEAEDDMPPPPPSNDLVDDFHLPSELCGLPSRHDVDDEAVHGLRLHTFHPSSPTTDFPYGYPTPIDNATMQWPAVGHVASMAAAPPPPMMEQTMTPMLYTPPPGFTPRY